MRLRRLVRPVISLALWSVRLLVMVIILRYSTPPAGDLSTALAGLAHDALFDYVGWMVDALGDKAGQTLFGVHPFMDEDARVTFVRSYMDDLAQVRTVEAQIDFIYADHRIVEPGKATEDLRAERDAMRADLRLRQSLVESILEGQIAAVLVDQGFGTIGQLLPPIAMRFTQPPNFLIISPRDEIRFETGIALDPLPVDDQTALETAVEADQDVSALIVPIGGVALFPAMVLERTSIPSSLDTFAHEWSHHYLLTFPLGLNYDFDSEARIINETTATLFGREVSRLVLARYYPDLLAAVPVSPPAQVALAPHMPAFMPLSLPSIVAQPPAFDFGAEMNETRIEVDRLLAAGNIDAAETYMEKRREVFVDNGYLIRRLNQAYFAFYGGYQTGAPGAGGEDPIGAAVQRLRDRSLSLHAWIVTMRSITTRDQLLAAANFPTDTTP
ncbi:MAG: hypothetical protein KC547_02300 [Anaerolineae bacterium]|nr:hypothetical protein [Anaerolineae bacterium]MCA9908219.1 hypothetical protein [Anaerolineae bacterium]